jgi:hypothetical protein
VTNNCDVHAPFLQTLGHNWIDVFKIDVEGSEFETFAALGELEDGMRFTQLQVEVHFASSVGLQRTANANREAITLLHSLMRSGLRTMSVEPNIYHAPQTCVEFAMIRMDGCGNVITPAGAL